MSDFNRGYIAVDLDGTLAHYEGWNGGVIGKPVPAMLQRVKEWLADGKRVKILTARVAGIYLPGATESVKHEALFQAGEIQNWCRLHIGTALEVTAVKDFSMIELWDDRAVGVIPNTGTRADGKDG